MSILRNAVLSLSMLGCTPNVSECPTKEAQEHVLASFSQDESQKLKAILSCPPTLSPEELKEFKARSKAWGEELEEIEVNTDLTAIQAYEQKEAVTRRFSDQYPAFEKGMTYITADFDCVATRGLNEAGIIAWSQYRREVAARSEAVMNPLRLELERIRTNEAQELFENSQARIAREEREQNRRAIIRKYAVLKEPTERKLNDIARAKQIVRFL